MSVLKIAFLIGILANPGVSGVLEGKLSLLRGLEFKARAGLRRLFCF